MKEYIENSDIEIKGTRRELFYNSRQISSFSLIQFRFNFKLDLNLIIEQKQFNINP